jgi:hypothetical protein
VTDDLTAAVQKSADADHARQPACSWCGKPGTPFEHNGVKFDLESTPLLVEAKLPMHADKPGVVYDLNLNTAAWSEENTPGCLGEPPLTAISVGNRPEYADYVRPGRRRKAGQK